jgi:uncharacterized membrane protein YccC
MEHALPRTDVMGGALGGALLVVFGVLLNGSGFDYNAVVAAFTVMILFGAGYASEKYKPFVTAVAAFAAVVLASLVGLAFGLPLDKLALSSALAGIAQALIVYLAPPHGEPMTATLSAAQPLRSAGSYFADDADEPAAEHDDPR